MADRGHPEQISISLFLINTYGHARKHYLKSSTRHLQALALCKAFGWRICVSASFLQSPVKSADSRAHPQKFSKSGVKYNFKLCFHAKYCKWAADCIFKENLLMKWRIKAAYDTYLLMGLQYSWRDNVYTHRWKTRRGS